MKIAIVNSNLVRIDKNTKKGTEIFDYILITNLAKYKKKSLEITAFASGNSKLPVKIESVSHQPSVDHKNIGVQNHIIFELSLISKALSMHRKFDIYHVNFGIGELVLPFSRFIKKPILVTMHGSLNTNYAQKFYALYKDVKNVYFVSISNNQRKPMPNLNYIRTIYHGVDTKKSFRFNPVGDKAIIWSGRAIPDKGLDEVLTVVKKIRKRAKIFPIIKEEYLQWLQDIIIKRRNIVNQAVRIYTDFDVHRDDLEYHYQTSKVFLFPVQYEEPFGLTLVESMACGTPVVAYARGSVPEIVKDGETGFIVNPSKDDKHGNWIIKKTGIDGLCEAVERIYSMPEEKYKAMRKACRDHVEKHFTVERMVDDYINVYEEILSRKH